MDSERRRQFEGWVRRAFEAELDQHILLMWANGRPARHAITHIVEYRTRRDGFCSRDKARVEFRRIVSRAAARLHEFEMEVGEAASAREEYV